jgi:hypothetical protein
MIFCSKYIVPKGYIGIAIFPFVFIRDQRFKKDKALINHERIHLKQQIELLIIPFFIWYGVEYLIRLLYYKNRHLAYKNISFEREAFSNESNVKYLNERGVWQFLKYLRGHGFSIK